MEREKRDDEDAFPVCVTTPLCRKNPILHRWQKWFKERGIKTVLIPSRKGDGREMELWRALSKEEKQQIADGKLFLIGSTLSTTKYTAHKYVKKGRKNDQTSSDPELPIT